MIEAQDIAVSIGHKPVVEALDFRAIAGEVTAIIGPNGSGKTTFLKALSGELPYRGTVTINGRDLRGLKPYEVATMRAVLPQASVLTFPFTVHEVVRLGLTAGRAGADLRTQAQLVEDALAQVDLSGFGGRFYQDISGGEQQRVQLARVLCQVWLPVLDGMPRFLLLDEPVSSLDIRHQLLIMEIARGFAAAGGGVVAILHDLNLTAMYADRVLAMHNGHGAAFGTPAAVLDDTLMRDVFECELRVGALPVGGRPFVLPQSAIVAS